MNLFSKKTTLKKTTIVSTIILVLFFISIAENRSNEEKIELNEKLLYLVCTTKKISKNLDIY
jgi:L-cystine uptake protein TcyP (sodium:dicarboxylate symporter family)